MDDKYNVFGFYMSHKVDGIDKEIYDDDIFMFTLFSNGRCGKKKYNKNNKASLNVIFTENYFYSLTNKNGDAHFIVERINRRGGCLDYIQRMVDYTNGDEITGINSEKERKFTPIR